MKRPIVLLFVLLFLPLSTVDGGLFISFTPDGSAKDFSVNIGEKIAIPLYLREDTASSHLSSGIYSAAVKLQADQLSSAVFTDAWLNSAFDYGAPRNVVDIRPSELYVKMVGSISAARTSAGDWVFPDSATNSIWIGSVEFQGLAPGMISLSTADYGTSKDVNQLVNGKPVNLDGLINWGTQSTLTTVPEPGTLALGLLGGCAVGLVAGIRRIRARRATNPEK